MFGSGQAWGARAGSELGPGGAAAAGAEAAGMRLFSCERLIYFHVFLHTLRLPPVGAAAAGGHSALVLPPGGAAGGQSALVLGAVVPGAAGAGGHSALVLPGRVNSTRDCSCFLRFRFLLLIVCLLRVVRLGRCGGWWCWRRGGAAGGARVGGRRAPFACAACFHSAACERISSILTETLNPFASATCFHAAACGLIPSNLTDLI